MCGLNFEFFGTPLYCGYNLDDAAGVRVTEWAGAMLITMAAHELRYKESSAS